MTTRKAQLLLLPLTGLLMACLLAGNTRFSTALTPTGLAADDPIAMLPSPTPSPESTLTPQQDIENRLAQYGITVANSSSVSVDELRPVVAAAAALGDKCPELFGLDGANEADRYAAVTRLFGPTVIRVYADRAKVDGVNYAINCGWEGRGAQGCKHPDIFPEQEYPEGAWLILFAGQPLLDDYKNTALVIHEMSHNLTWGGGHNPDNIDGFSYPGYVGDDFAITYSADLGIQLGSDAYHDQPARAANPRWRAEITADAIASWTLDLFQGPYADSVAAYIHDMLVCEITNGPLCQ
jgi:hypothetical protein